MRITLSAFALLGLSACSQLGWQETYNNAARNECRRNIDADARRACLDRVENNASARRAEGRS